MPRIATGEFVILEDGTREARITLKGRDRQRYKIAGCTSELEARARCKAMAAFAVRLRRAGELARADDILKWAARARPGREWEGVSALVDTVCSGNVEDAGRAKVPTLTDFAKDLTEGTLHKKDPDHVAEIDHTRNEQIFRLYVKDEIGHLFVDQVTLEDCERVMSKLPARLAAASRRHVAQLLSRLLKLAVYPGRYRKDHPIPTGWLPRVKNNKAKEYIRPTEDAKLLACVPCPADDKRGVPLVRRLLYGVLAREGFRVDEAASLRRSDLDLEVGRIRLDENKTDEPRAWPLDPGVAEALRIWFKHFRPNAGPDDHVFTHETGVPIGVEKLAEQLREDLAEAGVERPELFERSASRLRLRAHDLRATFVTTSLANGRTEAWVAMRTGHKSSAMINRYRRTASEWTELDLGQLAPLHLAIPEFAAITPRITPRGPESRRRHQRRGARFTSRNRVVPKVGLEPTRGVAPADFEAETPPDEIAAPEKSSHEREHGRHGSTPIATGSGQSRGNPDIHVSREAQVAELRGVIARAQAELARLLDEERRSPALDVAQADDVK